MNAIVEKLNSAGSLFVNFSAVMLVQASILIIILLALDFLLRKRVRAVFRYCIWLLVLVKLIVPPSISSPVGIGNLFGDKLSEIKIDRTETPGQVEQAGTIIKVPPLAIPEPKSELYKQIDPAETHLRSLEWQKEQAKIIETSTAEVEDQQKLVTESVSISWQGTAFLAWAIALLVLILLLIQRAMFVRGLVAQADEITGGLNNFVQSCGRLLGMKGKVRLKTSPNAASPVVCGLFRPVILLPQNLAPNLSKEQLKAVLLHELVHIKRGDLWISLFQALLQIVYFFNPFVWLANAIIRRARKQAVDEAVQVALGKSAESYPQILVNVAKLAFKKPVLSLRLIGVVEKKSALKNRIARMLSRPVPKKAKLGIIGLISVFLVAAVLLPMARAQKENVTDEADVQKPQFKAELNNNVTVELVGVCEHPSTGRQWWRPDGSLMNQRPYQKMPYVLGKDEVAFEFFAKAFSNGAPFELDSFYIEGAEKEGETYKPNINLSANTQEISRAIALPENVEQCDVEVGIYLERWQTQASSKGDEMVFGLDREYAFSKPIVQQDDSVRIVLSHDPPEGNLTQRLIVIDKDGNIHKSSFGKRTSTSKLEQYQVIFKNISLKNIKEFQFQTRPYEWVEFKNVSLKPNFKTDVKIEGERAAMQDSTEESSKNAKEVVLPDSSEDVIFDISRGEFIRLPVDSAEQAREFLDEKERGDVLYDYDDSNKPRIGFYKGVIYGHPWQMEDGFAAVRFEKEELPITFVVQLRNRERYTVTVVIAEENACRITYKRLKIHAGQDEMKKASGMIGQIYSFGPTIEKTINDDVSVGKDSLIDFDTGKLFSLPEDWLEKNADAMLSWCIERGIDASGATRASIKGLMCEDMIIEVAPGGNSYWDKCQPELLAKLDLWEIGKAGRPAYMTAQNTVPVTYIFKTREGGIGILQITGFNDEPRGINIRYKMIQAPAMLNNETKTVIQIEAENLKESRYVNLYIGANIITCAGGRTGRFSEIPVLLSKVTGRDKKTLLVTGHIKAYNDWKNRRAAVLAWGMEYGFADIVFVGENEQDTESIMRNKYPSAGQNEDSSGSISGKVFDIDSNPVADAIVLICEKQTGIPLTDGDYLPFTNGYLQGQQRKPTFATTDSDGNFSFENLPQGTYRLIAQSWPGVREVSDIFEVKSPIVNLNGIADNIDVAAGETVQVVIKPLGTGSLMINQDMPNDETCAVLSISPTRADPILGFAGWTGAFLQNMLGANRMPEGRTIVNGLPEGKIYIAMFAADSVPGWTEGQADIKANQTTGLPYVPFVNSWSNSRHDPPESLAPIFNEIKSLDSTQQKVLLKDSYKAVGLEPSEDGGIWGFMADIVDHLEKPVELPSGKKATFGEVMAAAQYIQLQRAVENKNKRIAQQNEQNQQVQNSTQQSSQAETENNLQQLIDSVRAGQMVTVPKGVYTEPIVINKSLRLKGEDANDCIIEVTADGPAIFVDTKGKGEVAIENLTIKWQLATSDKNIEYPFAVAVKDTTAQIKNCNFVPLGNYQRCPVALRAQGFTNMDVNNCWFEGFNYTVQYGESTEGILQNIVIANSGHQGVINYSGSTLRVKGNIITGSKFHAVRCTGGKLYVEDNLLINNENRGIYLGNKSASGTITNNVIMGNGTNISGFARSQVSITNNILADSSYAGISMRDSCRLLIADNIFLKNSRGIILHEEVGKNSNRVSKNTFWENAVNFENIEQFVTPIETQPGFTDPNNGDFSLKSGPVREEKQGLKQPEVFKALWKKFKKLEPLEGDF